MQPTIRSGREVVTGTPLRVGYTGSGGERVLLNTPELRVERGDRVTSSVRMAAANRHSCAPLSANLLPFLVVSTWHERQLGYYAQGHEGLPVDGSPLSILVSFQPMSEDAARTYLARFLFGEMRCIVRSPRSLVGNVRGSHWHVSSSRVRTC